MTKTQISRFHRYFEQGKPSTSAITFGSDDSAVKSHSQDECRANADGKLSGGQRKLEDWARPERRRRTHLLLLMHPADEEIGKESAFTRKMSVPCEYLKLKGKFSLVLQQHDGIVSKERYEQLDGYGEGLKTLLEKLQNGLETCQKVLETNKGDKQKKGELTVWYCSIIKKIKRLREEIKCECNRVEKEVEICKKRNLPNPKSEMSMKRKTDNNKRKCQLLRKKQRFESSFPSNSPNTSTLTQAHQVPLTKFFEKETDPINEQTVVPDHQPVCDEQHFSNDQTSFFDQLSNSSDDISSLSSFSFSDEEASSPGSVLEYSEDEYI